MIQLDGQTGRFVKIALPGTTFLHLDEVEVFGPGEPGKNLALHQPADQVSVSQWSVDHTPSKEPDWAASLTVALANCDRIGRQPGSLSQSGAELGRLRQQSVGLTNCASARQLFLEARRLQRRIALKNGAFPARRAASTPSFRPSSRTVIFAPRRCSGLPARASSSSGRAAARTSPA